MRITQVVLASLLMSATASLAQTGFTTQTYPAANDAFLSVADFNGDGKPDLLGYNPGFDSGDVYLNNGSGGFGAPVALTNAQGYIQIAKIGDMNGDGSPDIVACDIQSGRSANFAFLIIYLNDGKGNFTAGQMTSLPYSCSGMAIADVNHDGKQDVIVAGSATTSGSSIANNVIQTYFGDGRGNVGSPVTQQNIDLDSPGTSAAYTNCSIVDMNSGDFYTDNQVSIFVNSSCRPNGVAYNAYTGTTFLGHGNGSGNFTFALSHASSKYLTDGQTVNINGKPDATFYSATNEPTANLYYAANNGGGSFTYNPLAGDITAGGAPTPQQFYGDTTSDLTGDGLKDIASIFTTTVSNNVAQKVNPYISILAGTSNGGFVESQHWQVNPNSTGIGDLVSADFNGDGKIDLAALVLDGDYPNQTESLYVYTNTSGGSTACKAPTQADTNVICAPAKGSTTTSPVTVTAASNVTGFTLNRLYLDNKSVYQTSSQTINTPVTAGNGNHTLVLVSYNNQGQAFTYTTTFAVGSGGCLPSSPGVSVCQPAQGATTDSPVTITAGALAQSGDITALRFYVDGVSVYTSNNPGKTTSYQATQSVPLNTGSHRLVVVGYESTGGSVSFAENFTVAGNTRCYPATSGAMICSPVKGEATTSPVQVTSGATAASGYITALAIYVDNKQTNLEPSTGYKSFSATLSVPMTVGTHNLVVVGYQSTGGAVSTSETVTVK